MILYGDKVRTIKVNKTESEKIKSYGNKFMICHDVFIISTFNLLMKMVKSALKILVNICWEIWIAGRYKYNNDVSFSKHPNKVRIDMCIKDEHGAFVFAKTDWFSLIREVHIGEALGLLSTLDWVHKLNFRPIDFEMGTKIMVDSFLSPQHDIIEFGIVIQNCKTLFRQYYENSTIKFIRRQNKRDCS